MKYKSPACYPRNRNILIEMTFHNSCGLSKRVYHYGITFSLSLFLLIIGIFLCTEVPAQAGLLYAQATLNNNPANNPAREIQEVVDLRYRTGDELEGQLKELYPALRILTVAKTKQLTLIGSRKEINEAKDYIKGCDQPKRQITIQTQVIEITNSELNTLGVDWQDLRQGIQIGVDGNNGALTAPSSLKEIVQALASQGKAKVVASPRVATVENEQSLIQIGDRIPYAVPAQSNSSSTRWTLQYIDAGVKLSITPRMLEDGLISTTFFTQVSSIKQWRSTEAGEFPVLTTREAEGTVQVRTGETIVIGGLTDEEVYETSQKVPFLGDLPILGMFFTTNSLKTQKTEIIFMITPTLN